MNFVIFMPDEMRAESAACYGHPLVRTPNLDRLAGEGTLFEQCYVQHSVCSPSRCSMMTGWYPHVAGHRTLWHLLRSHQPNLLKYLHQAGYDIRWYGKNDLLAQECFGQCATEARGGGASNSGTLVRTGPEHPHYQTFLGEAFEGEALATGDGRSVARGIDYLRRGPEGPFCLYLPLSNPHPTYSAPRPWHDMYRGENVPPLRPADDANRPMFHRLIRQTRRLDSLPEAEFRRIAAVYLGQCSYIDYLLGEVLAALDQTGLAEDTCVIFTSDHGDWAGDFGLVEKWPSALDDCLARVPLVIRIPGAAAGHRVATNVELFDIMATVLDLAGIEATHTHFAHSLAPQLRGAAGERRTVFAEGGYDTHQPHCFEGRSDSDHADWGEDHIYGPKVRLQQTDPVSVCRSAMIRTPTHKLIYRTQDRCELYDMVADPAESRNLYDEPACAEVRADLEKQLLDWYLHTADVAPRDENPRGLPKGGFRQ